MQLMQRFNWSLDGGLAIDTNPPTVRSTHLQLIQMWKCGGVNQDL